MTHSWKVLAVSEREAVIKEIGGDIVVISSDAMKGYSFVADYLKLLSRNYGGHLRAADMLLQMLLGGQYRFVRASDRVYRTRLALVSLSCGFGGYGDGVDFDDTGVMNFRHVQCPLRSVCPVCGYSIRSRGGVSCCNPVHELGLTPRQHDVVDLLVNTSYGYKDIAEMMNLAEGRIRNIASEVFAVVGVCDRQELTSLLKGKRLR